MFRGVQKGTVDDKFRLKAPAIVRNSLLASYENPSVFITSLDGREVRIYPLAEWEAVERKLAKSSEDGSAQDGTRKKRILLRANHYGADGALDNQGRILIPGPLREGPGMRGEVHLQWSRNHVLVLSADDYRSRLADAELDQGDLAYADDLGV